MPESFLDIKESHGDPVEYRASPQRLFNQSLLQRPAMCSSFCTEGNVHECLSHITQELTSLGLSPVWADSIRHSELNVVAVLNCVYDLIQLHRRDLRALENMEVEQLKSNRSMEYLQLTSTQLKEQVELFKRENTGLHERERQLQLKVKSIQNCLKNEKEEVQKLQNIISNRAGQYNHEMKRKEREFNKLKERLNQLLSDKKDRKQAIDVLNSIGRADGKRSLWKTEKTEARHEGEMYKTLLTDYDNRQRELLLENAELKKVLQHMKNDMVSILKAKKPSTKNDKCDIFQKEEQEDEENVFDSTKMDVELFSDDAREKLTNGIRLQWRRLKSHVERLDSQASLVETSDKSSIDSVSRVSHEEEMHKLRLEIQQCKDYIGTQQHLLQRQLSSPCDDEVTSLLNNCYMQQEKERLSGEWKHLEEQKKIFDRERSNFTEAAIRLSHERKAFEEDRAMWLKYQFLNLSPFPDSNKPQISRTKSVLSTCKNPGSAAENVIHGLSDTSTPKDTPVTSSPPGGL
ncbi:afadin- and alpha-actinin-binding protein-like isoform X2 [Eucyclogobius newberryi]|uniref:afadin- and alpha-actinin-binding protein-like isoform X2 n=1 Tax=Eucyclogobius newberryi TaxID=166745 RepID=UPI003B59400C